MSVAESSAASSNLGADKDGCCSLAPALASSKDAPPPLGGTAGTLALVAAPGAAPAEDPAVQTGGRGGRGAALASLASPDSQASLASRRRVEIALELQASLCLDRAAAIELTRAAREWTLAERRRRLEGFQAPRASKGVAVRTSSAGGGSAVTGGGNARAGGSGAGAASSSRGPAALRRRPLPRRRAMARRRRNNEPAASPLLALPAAQSSQTSQRAPPPLKPAPSPPPTVVWATWRGDALRLGSLPVCCPEIFATSLSLIGLVDLCQFRAASVGAAVASDMESQRHLRDFRFHPRLFENPEQKSRRGRTLLAPRCDAERRLARFLLWPSHVDRFERLDLSQFPAEILETKDVVQAAIGRMRRLSSLVLPLRGWSTTGARSRFIAALPSGLSVVDLSSTGADVPSASQATARQLQGPSNGNLADPAQLIGLRELVRGWDSFVHSDMAKVHTHLRAGACLGKFPPRRRARWEWSVDDPSLPAVREHLAALEEPPLADAIVDQGDILEASLASAAEAPSSLTDAAAAPDAEELDELAGSDGQEHDKTSPLLGLRDLIPSWDSLSQAERTAVHAHLRVGLMSGKFMRRWKGKWAWPPGDSCLSAVKAHLAEMPSRCGVHVESSGGASPSSSRTQQDVEEPKALNCEAGVATLEARGGVATSPPKPSRNRLHDCTPRADVCAAWRPGACVGSASATTEEPAGEISPQTRDLCEGPPAASPGRGTASRRITSKQTPERLADVGLSRTGGAGPRPRRRPPTIVKLRDLVPLWDELDANERGLVQSHLRAGACAGKFPEKTGFRWQWSNDDQWLPVVRMHLAEIPFDGVRARQAAGTTLAAGDSLHTADGDAGSCSRTSSRRHDGGAILELRDLVASWDDLSQADRQHLCSYVDAGADAGKYLPRKKPFWEWSLEDPCLAAVRAHLAAMPALGHTAADPPPASSRSAVKVPSSTPGEGAVPTGSTNCAEQPADDDAGRTAAARLRALVPGWDMLPDLQRLLVLAHLRAGAVGAG